MPVGKNSIKRAVNNGYSKVKTSAPDMENSEVLVKEEKVEVKAPVAKKPTAKKTSVTKKAAPAKASVKKATPIQKAAKKDGFVRVEVGGEMPYYLL